MHEKCLTECLNVMIMDCYDELLEELDLDMVVMVEVQAWKQSVYGLTPIQSDGESLECNVQGGVITCKLAYECNTWLGMCTLVLKCH